MANGRVYIKLKGKNPRKSYYGFVTNPENGLSVFEKYGIPFKADGYSKTDGSDNRFNIVLLSTKKKYDELMEKAFKEHERNIVLFGWDKDETYRSMMTNMGLPGWQ